jgi:hypothetical protein
MPFNDGPIPIMNFLLKLKAGFHCRITEDDCQKKSFLSALCTHFTCWFFMNLIIVSLFFFLPSYIEAFAEVKTHFSFSNEPIDVVIPSTEKDLYTLNLCIDGIRKNGENIRRIIVVSKNKLTDQAEWYNEASYPFSFQDVAKALAQGDLHLQKTLSIHGSRTGWYYQQLLKLYAPLVIPDISSNVLILDSDTIFLNPVTFLNNENAGMYNTGVEYNDPYFRHAELLIPGFYKIFPDYSGISHHMIFQRPVIDKLFSQVESTYSEPFWSAFCHLVDKNGVFGSGASEYEIYFNYVFSLTDQVSIRQFNWRNIQRLKEIRSLKKQGLHYVSIHTYDRVVD